jgi:hypothetical protein
MSEEQKQPTREELIDFLNESIELAKLRAELQELNTKIAMGRADELRALVMIGQITNPQPQEEMENHIITEEDMANNPDLKDAGINVGDEIPVPKTLKRKLKTETAQ